MPRPGAAIALLLLCAVVGHAYTGCRQPQRTGIFSLEALSNRDQITKVFHNITSQLKRFSANTTIQGLQYQVANLSAALYYNDYAQAESIVDTNTVRVQSGKLHAAFHASYSYGSANRGNLSGRIEADPFYFVKGLKLTDGQLQWYPSEVHDIVFSQFSVLESQPKLPEEERKRFENMLNNNTEGDVRLKSEFVGEVNRLYGELLQSFLNSEQLLNTTNFNYTYKGRSISYLNLVSNFTLTNSGFKGLTFQMLFEVLNYQTRCNVLPTAFGDSAGGLQEYIGMETLYSSLLYALEQGWFNVQLDRSWDSDLFQFYSGDVANFIEEAGKRVPNEAVTGECHWNNTEFELILSRFSDTALYVSIPYSCSLLAGATKLQSMYFSLNMQVRLTLRSNDLQTEVVYVGAVRPTFFSEGSYRVTDESVAARYIQSVASTITNRPTFGSGFPANQRNYPQLNITRQYLLLYDPSEK